MSHSWIQNLVAGNRRYALPIMTAPGIPLIEASAADVFRSGALQFQAIKTLIGRYPATAAALTMMDLSVEAEAFGATVRFNDHENPDIIRAAMSDLNDIKHLRVPDIGLCRTTQFLSAAKLCAEEIHDRPTLGGMIGPFSLAGRLLDMGKLMLSTMTEPATVHDLLEKTTSFLIEYAKAFKETGCAGLLMAEPAAGLISPQMAAEFSYRYVKRIVEAVKDEHFVFVLHNCGRTEKMIGEMLATDASALHLGNGIDLTKILPQVPADIPVMGNLDPSSVFLLGTAEQAYEKTTQLLRATEVFPNFVLSSGCDIPAGTPLTNLDAFFEALAVHDNVSAGAP